MSKNKLYVISSLDPLGSLCDTTPYPTATVSVPVELAARYVKTHLTKREFILPETSARSYTLRLIAAVCSELIDTNDLTEVSINAKDDAMTCMQLGRYWYGKREVGREYCMDSEMDAVLDGVAKGVYNYRLFAKEHTVHGTPIGLDLEHYLYDRSADVDYGGYMLIVYDPSVSLPLTV